MAEYIEREALVYELKEEHEFIMNNPEIRKQTKWREALCYNRTLKAVYKQPAADVVEVVRCKECAFRGDLGDCECWDSPLGEAGLFTDDDFYCSYGERRSDDD